MKQPQELQKNKVVLYQTEKSAMSGTALDDGLDNPTSRGTIDGEEDAAYFSSLFQMCDGNWLVNNHFLTYELSTVLEFLKQDDGSNKNLVRFEDDTEDCFFYLEDYLPLDEKGGELNQVLSCRGLALSSILVRCLAVDLAPPYVRIRRLPEETATRNRIFQLKKQANEAFFFRDYDKALQLYDQALGLYPTDFICGVVPSQDLAELVNILSSQADCYFRMDDFWNVGQMASYALLFDAGHAKSRILRAKAALALARLIDNTEENREPECRRSLRYTVQSKSDLEEVLRSLDTTTTRSISKPDQDTARELLEEVVGPLMERERKFFEHERPDGEWNVWVRAIMATCWRKVAP
jgi:tetratricopeptide (TPR) repeat protein